MYRRKEDIRTRVIEHAQGGEGHVTFEDWLLPEEAYNHGRVFSKVIIAPHSSIGYHVHHHEFEAYLVLSGEATVVDGEETVILHAGDMNLCKDGDGHSTTNNTDEDLVLLAMIMTA